MKKKLLVRSISVCLFLTFIFGNSVVMGGGDGVVGSPEQIIYPDNNNAVKNREQYCVSYDTYPARVAARRLKEWNFIVYIAANNNLQRFSIKNIKQMSESGSSDLINVLVQLDGLGQKDIKRYYVDKNKAVVLDALGYSNATTSGTALSLYEFLKWAILSYPAKHQAVVLWNHGSGIKDPSIWGKLFAHRDEFFYINYETGMLELNRSQVLERALSRIKDKNEIKKILRKKGIAFNDTFETYLTNQDLTKVLEDTSKYLLDGKKIDVVAMDACHMGMIEVASQIKNAANYMVASEEIEPGSGYNYATILNPFGNNKTMDPENFSKHLVYCYQKEYQNENADYTQSAVELENVDVIEKDISKMVELLKFLLQSPERKKVFESLKYIRTTKRYTTTFCDPDYIDLGHFYASLSLVMSDVLSTQQFESEIKTKMEELVKISKEGLENIQKCVIGNATGMNLLLSRGLSLYFPVNNIHKSYLKTVFDEKTHWSSFLHLYIKGARKFREKVGARKR
jgi:hypothetical protein